MEVFQAAAGLGPDVENEIVVLKRSSLGRAGYGLKQGNNGGDRFLQVVGKFGDIFFVFDVVNNDVVGGAQDFEVFFGEIGYFESRIGEPVVLRGTEGVVGGLLHAVGDFPAGGHGDGKLDGTVFA